MTQQLLLWRSIDRKCLSLLLHRTNTRDSLYQIHAFMLRNAVETNVNIFTKFVAACVSLAGIHHARWVFDHRPHRDDTFLCNFMIKAHVGERQFAESFALYKHLRRYTDFVPDNFTFTALGDSALYNALIDGYVKSGDMGAARKLFDEMADRNVISWTSMIYGYCTNGDVLSAKSLFDSMPEKNLFSWNVMIGGYCQNKQPHEALKLFRELQSSGLFEPDEVTIVSILPAIADLGALDLGGWVHQFVRRKKLDRAVNVCTALVDMYAKCGEITKARRVFDGMPEKEMASWNALINGFAVNGRAKEALEVFLEMMQKGIKPNDVTMIGVLSACNHGGLVEEGKRWFKAMEEFELIPRIEHYGCMVDLLGRAGRLDEAEKLIKSMPYEANGIILSSFLCACGYWKDVTRAERVVNKVIDMDPWNDGNYVMLRNLYAVEERWRDAENIKGLMRRNRVKKEAGCSVIEVDFTVCEFLCGGDREHPHKEVIETVLWHLWMHMRGQGS